PGLVNTHHHMYQNLTRSYAPAINGSLFSWLAVLYPLRAGLDEAAADLSAWQGRAELALGRWTTTSDHLSVAPQARGALSTPCAPGGSAGGRSGALWSAVRAVR